MADIYKNYQTTRVPSYPVPIELSKVIENNLEPWVDMTPTEKFYLNVLSNIEKSGRREWNAADYLYYQKLMLWVEQLKNTTDLEKYNINNQKLLRDPERSYCFQIHVESLAEERPSIVEDDIIYVIDVETNVTYTLKIIKIMKVHIIAAADKEFCQSYKEDKLYNIEFHLNDYPFRCQHFALSRIHKFNLTSYVFPTSQKINHKPIITLNWFNKEIAGNQQQKQCILNILKKTSLGAPYILYGPPGTGKTATLIEAVCQAMINTDKHILICTPSNTAADVITKRLLKYLVKNNTQKKAPVHRMYSRSKVVSTIDKDILDYANVSSEGTIVILPLHCLPKIIITTLCTSTRFILQNIHPTDFSYIFIDEAGQAAEPETMIPFSLLSSHFQHHQRKLHGQMVLAGDPKQLGPVIMSKLADIILGKSMLERMMDFGPYKSNENGEYNPNYVTKLLINYRSNPNLIHVSSKLFYHNALKPYVRSNKNWNKSPNPKFPIIFHGVRGTHSSNKRSPSLYNTDEVYKVTYYVNRLIGSYLGTSIIKESDIGIITPYIAQKIKLQLAMEDSGFKNIEVGTVQTFQGKEKEIIILSTVRGENGIPQHYNIGFIANPKRFNVSITRAKSLMIVIGHPNVLEIDDNWNYLLQYCIQNNAYVGDQYKEQPNRSVKNQPVLEKSFKLVDNNGTKKNISPNTNILSGSVKDLPKDNNETKQKIPMNIGNNVDDCNRTKKNIYSNNIRLQDSYPKGIEKKEVCLDDHFSRLNINTTTNNLDPRVPYYESAPYYSRSFHQEKNSKSSRRCTIL